MREALAAVSRHGALLQSLELSISGSERDSIACLSHLPALESLVLWDVPCDHLHVVSQTLEGRLALRTLVLSVEHDCSLSDLPDDCIAGEMFWPSDFDLLGGLQSLTSLTIDNMALGTRSRFPSELRKLENLQGLHVLGLSRIPATTCEVLGDLKHLEALAINVAGWTQHQTARMLHGLSQLIDLRLAGSGLDAHSTLAHPLKLMQGLQTLELRGFTSSSWAPFIHQAILDKRALGEVGIIAAPPTTGVAFAENLPPDIDTSLPITETHRCPALKCFLGKNLNLNANTVAEVVAGSHKLERMQLVQDMPVRVNSNLLMALENASSLQHLEVPFADLAAEISGLADYPKRIIRSLRSQLDGTAFDVPVCTIVVVGDSRSSSNRDDRLGKTQLCTRLRGQAVLPPGGSDVTRGFERHHAVFAATDNDRKTRSVECVLMDFGGQKELLSAHRLFLGTRLVYAICIDARDSLASTRVLHWLNTARVNSLARGQPEHGRRHPPCVIVETHAGRSSKRGYRIADLKSIVNQYQASCETAPHIEIIDGYDNYDDPDGEGLVRIRAAVGRCLASAGVFGGGFDRLSSEAIHMFLHERYPLAPIDSIDALAEKLNRLNRSLPYPTEQRGVTLAGPPKLTTEELIRLIRLLRDLGLVTWFGDWSRNAGPLMSSKVFDPAVINELLYAIVDPTLNLGTTLTDSEFARILRERRDARWADDPQLLADVVALLKETGLIVTARHGSEHRVVVPDRIESLRPDTVPTTATREWPLVMTQVVTYWPDRLVPALIAEHNDCLAPTATPARNRLRLFVPSGTEAADSEVQLGLQEMPQSDGRVHTRVSISSPVASDASRRSCVRMCAWLERLYEKETGDSLGAWRETNLVIDQQANANQRNRQTERVVTARRNWLDAISVETMRRDEGVQSAMDKLGVDLATVSDVELRRRLTVVAKADLTDGERGWATVAAVALTSFDSKSSSTASLRRLAAFVSQLDHACQSRATDPKHSSGLADESHSLKAVLAAGLPDDDDVNSAAALFARGRCWRPGQSEQVISHLSFARLLSSAVTKMFGSRRAR
ncbi:MAG: hypothetical protein SFY96_01480 [Planctomycetota bacterium]|nr:hypothetical protein [Planctomycetota bacterium]